MLFNFNGSVPHFLPATFVTDFLLFTSAQSSLIIKKKYSERGKNELSFNIRKKGLS